MSKKGQAQKGQANNQTLFWVVFGIVAVGLVLLLVTGAYRPQPQAAPPFGGVAFDDFSDIDNFICPPLETPLPGESPSDSFVPPLQTPGQTPVPTSGTSPTPTTPTPGF